MGHGNKNRQQPLLNTREYKPLKLKVLGALSQPDVTITVSQHGVTMTYRIGKLLNKTSHICTHRAAVVEAASLSAAGGCLTAVAAAWHSVAAWHSAVVAAWHFAVAAAWHSVAAWHFAAAAAWQSAAVWHSVVAAAWHSAVAAAWCSVAWHSVVAEQHPVPVPLALAVPSSAAASSPAGA